jgi:hypothetical protein
VDILRPYRGWLLIVLASMLVQTAMSIAAPRPLDLSDEGHLTDLEDPDPDVAGELALQSEAGNHHAHERKAETGNPAGGTKFRAPASASPTPLGALALAGMAYHPCPGGRV